MLWNTLIPFKKFRPTKSKTIATMAVLIENNDYLNGETTHCDRAKIIAEWFENDNRRERQEVEK